MKLTNRMFLLGLFLIFMSCTSTHDYAYPIIVAQNGESTIKLDLNQPKFTHYKPLYIGPSKSKIEVKSEVKVDKQKEILKSENYKLFFALTDLDIKVSVDTTQTFVSPLTDYFELNNSSHSYGMVNSHPVMIENLSSLPIQIGNDTDLFLCMEAKNENGKWRKVESNVMRHCVPTPLCVSQNEIVISAMPIYEGSLKTTARLRFGKDIFSNTFEVYINQAQYDYTMTYVD